MPSVISLIRTTAARRHGFAVDDRDVDRVRMYWCEGIRAFGASCRLLCERRNPFFSNFGDALSPMVVSLMTGRRVAYSSGRGKLMALGSIFFALSDHDVVWGSGLLEADHIKYAKAARNVTYLAVRGPRTRTALRKAGIDCPEVYGDPAMLLPRFVRNDIAPRYDIGVVPHWSHVSAMLRGIRDPGVKVIDVRGQVDVVASEILSCRRIVSTSLHGLILAEAYGIPAVLAFYRAAPRGDAHKFEDYFQSTDRELFVRRVTDIAAIPALADEVGQVPAPRFRHEPLVKAFPLHRAPPTTPALAWSAMRRDVCASYRQC